MQTLIDEEQEKCRTSTGLFEVLNEKFKPQYNETIVPLQYCTLIRDQNKNAKERMGHLKIKASKCVCKENDSKLKGKKIYYIYSIDYDDMMAEII